jgi:hypothetical protein
MWQLPRVLHLAAAYTVAVAATKPESEHGDDAHTAELLTNQKSDMACGQYGHFSLTAPNSAS